MKISFPVFKQNSHLDPIFLLRSELSEEEINGYSAFKYERYPLVCGFDSRTDFEPKYWEKLCEFNFKDEKYYQAFAGNFNKPHKILFKI